MTGGLPVRPWLLLIYRIPRDPTAGRVYVWRKLKQLGAVALQDAVWVLPGTPRTLEQFRWLSAEITELGGDATLLSAEQVYATDAEGMKKQFVEPVEAEYRAILTALEEEDRDLSALSRRFQQAQARDYFASEIGRQARERLLAARGGESS
jgi:hypothetical protein